LEERLLWESAFGEGMISRELDIFWSLVFLGWLDTIFCITIIVIITVVCFVLLFFWTLLSIDEIFSLFRDDDLESFDRMYVLALHMIPRPSTECENNIYVSVRQLLEACGWKRALCVA
jgi:hypothetical protein